MQKFAVIGLGRFGMRLARLLADSGAQVIAIDRKRERIEAVRDRVDRAVVLDSTDEQSLKAQGIDKVDVAVVGIGTDFEANALTTVILKQQLGVPRVISRATTTVRGQILSRIGADDTVNPERESAERWSKHLLAPSIMEQIELAEGYSLVQIAAPSAFAGKTLKDLAISSKYQVNVIAIRRIIHGQDDKVVISAPMADTIIEPEDILLVIGGDEAIASLPAD